MKRNLFIAILLFSSNSNSDSQRAFPNLEGPLLGQNPPGMVAEPFASGIISKDGWELEGVFAPGMEEFYFTTDSGKDSDIMVIGLRIENNVWQKHIEFKRRGEITFSPDGQRMHMAKGYKDRIGKGWSVRQSLGPLFDRDDWGIMRLTASAKGTYVFDDYKSNDVIRISTVKDGQRQAPTKMGPVVNSGKMTAHPFIAPDESYLIWDSEREGGYGDSDLYISFRQQDGSWGSAINMGEQVNSPGWDAYASVTPDGKYILFNRTLVDGTDNTDIYWVDAKIIDVLRDQHLEQAPEVTTHETKLSFKDIPLLEQAFIDASPSDLKDGIEVGTLGADGGKKQLIMKLAQEIAENKHGNFDSLLIAHKGKLIFESYYRRGRVNLPHPQASATKAYTGLALGRAIQMGYLTMADLDKPVVSFLKGLDPTKFVAGVEKITLNQALTMRGGLRIDDDTWDELQENPAALQGQGLIQTIFEHSEPVTTASQKFSYGNFNPNMVMQVIDAVVPGTATDFIKNELLDKMGIMAYDWKTAVSGLPRSGSGSSMTSRAMVKWGTLARNKGQWNGEQLISEKFITKATNRIIYTPDEELHYGGKDVSHQGYGYFWWNADLNHNNKSHFSSSAQGGYGQFIVLIEALDLMTVFTAHDNESSFMQIIAERILPAFIE